MRLEQSFEVPVPVAQAWGVLLDLERVAPCMPGATLTSFDGTAFAGTVKVKLGPISLAYRGHGRITERDEYGRRLAFVAQGQDSRGAGGASARVAAVLHTAGDGTATLVKVVTDLDISGKAAQFGRGLIADVSGKVIKQFADNLAATIRESGAPAPVPAPAPPSEPVTAPAPTEPVEVVAPIATPAPAMAVDAVPPAVPPPLAPVFSEPAARPAPPPPPPVAPVFPPPPKGWEPPAPTAPEAAEPVATQPEPVAAEPEYVAPTPSNSAPPAAPDDSAPQASPEYHPLALQEPDADAAAYAQPAPPPRPEPEPVAQPASTYAYTPEPAPAPETAAPPPLAAPSPPSPGLRQPPVEAEPLDLLAVSGAKGMLRRAAPVLIIVGVALVALIVWLVASN